MVYVFAIRGNLSGGSESLHQLAYTLSTYGVDVKMIYPDSSDNTVPYKFQKYKLDVAEKVEDSSKNIMIVPETETSYLYKYKNIRKCIWWLSRDFYYGYCNYDGLVRSAQRHNIHPKLYGIYIPIVYLKKKLTPRYFKFKNDKNNIFHLYNCEYVREYLIKKGILKNNMLYMCGPISNEYFSIDNKVKKENIIVFNPKKNYQFTKLIIDRLKKEYPKLKVIAIEGMSTIEIVSLLEKAKIYIDFGQFPGPERIPREAVTKNCNIITSTYGSAKNDIDVPIPEEFKIDAVVENIDIIINKIIEQIDNYEMNIHKFEKYREHVREQRTMLISNTKKFIKIFKL